jgi:transcription elongation factor Elf1
MKAKRNENKNLDWANIVGDMWECPNCGERDYTEGVEDDQETVWCGGCGTRLRIEL